MVCTRHKLLTDILGQARYRRPALKSTRDAKTLLLDVPAHERRIETRDILQVLGPLFVRPSHRKQNRIEQMCSPGGHS